MICWGKMWQMTTCLSCLRSRSRLHEGLPCCSSSMTLMPNAPIAYTVVCMRLLNLPVFLLWSEFTFFFSPVPLLLWRAVWSAYKGFWKKKKLYKGFRIEFWWGDAEADDDICILLTMQKLPPRGKPCCSSSMTLMLLFPHLVESFWCSKLLNWSEHGFRFGTTYMIHVCLIR